MKTSLSISVPVLFGTESNLGVRKTSFNIKQKVLNNWWSTGNATSMASIFEFCLILLFEAYCCRSSAGIMFSGSLRLKLEDLNVDLRMKWMPVGEGKNPVLANEKSYCQISAGSEPEWWCQTEEDAEPQLIFSEIFLIC